MTHIYLKDVSLTFPLLGAGFKSTQKGSAVDGAGAVIRDTNSRTRSITALNSVSLKALEGARIGLVGRNGSGKSTLLRVIAGIYEPTFGRIDVHGSITSLLSVGLGVSPESSGYRNIELLGLVAGFTFEQIEQMKPGIAEFSGLGDYLHLPVRTYSNGMAMRLKFACGTAFSSEILLLDEWLAAGDPEFRKKAHERMRTLVEDAGILILASHSPRLLRQECEHLLWLHKGQVRLFDDTETVLREMDKANKIEGK